MSGEKKIYEVTCCKCNRKFHHRLEMTDENAEGTERIAVECQFCSEKIIIEISRKYAKKDTLIRTLPA